MGAPKPTLQVEFDRPGEAVDLGSTVSGRVALDLPGPGLADRVTVLCTWADGRGGYEPRSPASPTVLHEGPLGPGTHRLGFALPVADGPLGFRGGIEIAWGVRAVAWRGRKEVLSAFATFPTAAPAGPFRYAFPPGVEVPDPADVRVSRHTLGNLAWGVVEALFAATMVLGLATGAADDALTRVLSIGLAAFAGVFSAVHLRRGLRNLRGLRSLRGLELRVPVRHVRWGEWARAEVLLPPGRALAARVELSCVEGYDGGEGEASYHNVLWSQSEVVPQGPGGGGPAVVSFQVTEGAPPTYRSENQWLEWRLELHAWPPGESGKPFWAARAVLLVGP